MCIDWTEQQESDLIKTVGSISKWREQNNNETSFSNHVSLKLTHTFTYTIHTQTKKLKHISTEFQVMSDITR